MLLPLFLFLNLDPEPLISRYNASRRMVEDIPLDKQVRPELDKVPAPPPETLEDELEADPVFSMQVLDREAEIPVLFDRCGDD